MPVRFCEPAPEAQPSGIPTAWCSARRTPEPRLSICSGRPTCRQTLRADAVRARGARTGGRRATAAPDRERQRRAARRARALARAARADEQRHEHGGVDLRRDREPEQDAARGSAPVEDRTDRAEGHQRRRRGRIASSGTARAARLPPEAPTRHAMRAVDARRAVEREHDQHRRACEGEDHQRLEGRVVPVLRRRDERRDDERHERQRADTRRGSPGRARRPSSIRSP